MPQADCQSACIPLGVKTNESNSIGRVNGRGQVPSKVPRRGRIGLGVDELMPLNPCEARAVRAPAHLAASFAQPSARCGDAPHVAPGRHPFLERAYKATVLRELAKESARTTLLHSLRHRVRSTSTMQLPKTHCHLVATTNRQVRSQARLTSR